MSSIDPALRALALSVARCHEIGPARDDPAHPCHRVVCVQEAGPSWQVPEAWAGNLAGARVLFVSSNPSISVPKEGADPGTAEAYPDSTWGDDAVADFVTGRFPTYATADGRHLRRDGVWSTRSTKFWRNVRTVAAEVLGPDADPAANYAMTEVVHCKSKDEVGVREAVGRCTDRHLDRIVAACPAPVIVVLGTKALGRVRKAWDLPAGMNPGKAGEGPVVVRSIGGRPRLVAYLRHPSDRGAVPLLSTAYPTRLQVLRQVAAGEVAPRDASTPQSITPAVPDAGRVGERGGPTLSPQRSGEPGEGFADIVATFVDAGLPVGPHGADPGGGASSDLTAGPGPGMGRRGPLPRTRDAEETPVRFRFGPNPWRLHWEGALDPSDYNEWFTTARHRLADAGRAGRWDAVLALLDDPDLSLPTNSWRPGGPSWFTTLHHAAWHGAPLEVITALLDRGAWRAMPTADGRLAHHIAAERGHHHLVPLLTPPAPVPAAIVAAWDTHLRALVDDVARDVRDEHGPLRYPTTAVLPELPARSADLDEVDTPTSLWFAVPGLYGGFALRLADPYTVEVTSESRVVWGSGQRHHLTVTGVELVEEW